MTSIDFGCRPTAIGSMPQTDPAAACSQVVKYFKDIPFWPQLPRRSFRENMYAQYSQGFPGLVEEEDRIYVDRSPELDRGLEALYTAYLDNDVDRYAIGPDYAAGLHSFLSLRDIRPLAVKGQVTGPVSWGLTVTDASQRSVIYDDTLADAAARLLRLKAAWQEKALSAICPDTIIFVDEPYMSSFGSAFVSLSKDRVTTLMEEVLGGIRGLKGIHCCGNTDWSVLLGTSIDIISYDTYNYGPTLALYPAEVGRLLARGGAIAWGIVPNDEESLARESVASLRERLEEAMTPFTRDGIGIRQLVARGLLTPSCTLASVSADAAERAVQLLVDLSLEIRKRYS